MEVTIYFYCWELLEEKKHFLEMSCCVKYVKIDDYFDWEWTYFKSTYFIAQNMKFYKIIKINFYSFSFYL